MSYIRTIIKILVPASIRYRVRLFQSLTFELILNYIYDFRNFIRWSSVYSQNDLYALDRRQLEALLTIEYHALEKGLSLKTPRPGFGADRIRKIFRFLDIYVENFGLDQIVPITLNVLQKYEVYNSQHGIVNEQLRNRIFQLKQLQNAQECITTQGGVLELSRDDILAAGKQNLESFFASRHSIRQFADKEVSIELVTDAVKSAQRTPSVCNRQSWRVHIFTDTKQKEQILRHQNGNRGFGDQADKILIVTTDLRAFSSIGERYQFWIDGGMFAMSLVYAFHSLGLGTCCLNWSVQKETDRKLHSTASIPEHEAIVMLLAIGHLPEKFRIAQSPRRQIDDVLILH